MSADHGCGPTMCPLWHWRATLIAWDTSFRKHLGPRELRILGRRVLDAVAPEVADEQKRRALEREEAAAARDT